MYYMTPDPFPGRCRNFRYNSNIMQNERCLDYDNEIHVCSFEDRKPTGISWSGVRVSAQANPKPWVKPGDTREDRS